MPTPKTARPQSRSRTTAKASPGASSPIRRKSAPAARLTLAETMRVLERAGSAQTRKTYARHGVTGPMFGVSFATLKDLTRRIDVDHDLALALWDTGNFDARNLAVKVVDPARLTAAQLDRWARENAPARMCGGYVAGVACEGPHGLAKAAQWLADAEPQVRATGWTLWGQLAQRDEQLDDAVFAERIAAIARDIHEAPNAERASMNAALIAIGGRNEALRNAAIAAARRIGTVDVDHGDTECRTPDAEESITKAWAHARAKGFASPAAQERDRDTPRRRC